eukprot:GSChrysophyteH1.ASY1.ANO1.897.1 assembled CDS
MKFGGKPNTANQSKASSSASLMKIIFASLCLLISLWVAFLLFCWDMGMKQINIDIKPQVALVDAAVHSAEHEISFLLGGYEGEHVHLNENTVDAHAAAAVHAEQLRGILNNAPKNVHAVVADEQAQVKDEIHIVFSTDCTPYQDWQTLTLFHSAKVVGQKGPITRIASGCDDKKKQELTELYEKLWGDRGYRYRAHFTPDFKKDEKTKKKYDFYNKPWGVKHWLEHAEPAVPNDIVVALLDPDMLLLRPITTEVASQTNAIWNKFLPKDELIEKVSKGRPVAQLYGLGAPWVNDDHKKFNRRKTCGEGSPCLQAKNPWAERHFSVGPPYLVHKEDMVRISSTWTKFVPRVYEGYPHLLAEMYAYSMAAAHENLPHLQGEHYMVSNTDVYPGEGWKWVDQLEDSCVAPGEDGIYFPGQNLPTVMHFCQFFRAGDYGFQKRRVPKNIFSCDSPMMSELPADLYLSEYQIKQDEKVKFKGPKQAKRHAFSLCVLHRSINAALIDYKKHMCPNDGADANYEKKFNVAGMKY